jgi:CHAT domain-containing protein
LAKLFGDQNPHLARLQIRMADLLLDDGQPAEAEKVLSAVEQVLGTSLPAALALRGEMDLVQARLHLAKGERKKAIVSADQARRKFHQYSQDVLPWLPAADQRHFIENVDRPHLERALRLALELKDDENFAKDAFQHSAEWILNSKGQAYEAAAKLRLFARELNSPETVNLLNQYAILQSLIARRLNDPLPTRNAEREIVVARREIGIYEDASRELHQQLAEAFQRSSIRSAWVQLEGVQANLPELAVYLDFVAVAQSNKKNSNRKYWAWCITREGTQDRILEISDAELVHHPLRAFHSLVDNDEVIGIYVQKAEKVLSANPDLKVDSLDVGLQIHGIDLREQLSKVSEALLQPCLEILNGKNDIILCPDGPLWTVPWAALEIENEVCLIERFTIQHLTSGRQTVQVAQKMGTTDSHLVLNPDYEFASSQMTNPIRRAMQAPLDPINAAKDDLADFIRKVTDEDVVVMTGVLANEEAVSRIKNPKVLVLGTHGMYYNEGNPHLETIYAHDPLTRCLLTMAGSNWEQPDEQDDAILYGNEIVSMDLRGTELVYLMACQSGLGMEAWGEAPAGLNHAFHLAGSRKVVATLWSVLVDPTVELSVEFFRNLATGQSEFEAMRSAQLKIKADYEARGIRNPSIWAPYVVSGW